jgi:hypothetical protein
MQPAPKSVGLSRAEEMISDYNADQRANVRPAPTSHLRAQTEVFLAAKHGDLKRAQILGQKSIAAGEMSHLDVQHALERARQTPLVADYKRVTDFPTAMRIYDAATDDEKKLIQREARNKVFAARSKPWLWSDPDTGKIVQKYWGVKPSPPRVYNLPQQNHMGSPAHF